MPLTTLVLAGGALYAGIQVYVQQHRSKKRPWLQGAEQQPTGDQNITLPSPDGDPTIALAECKRTQFIRWLEGKLPCFFSSERSQVLIR